MIENTHKLDRKKAITKLQMALLFMFCSIFSISAQKNFLDFRLKLTIEDGDLLHAKIAITKNGVPFRVIDSKARYDLELDIGVEYIITASKIGYITKSIVLDTRVPSGREQDEFAKFQSEISLKPQPENEEITYTQPVGRITFSNTSKDFDYDKDYSAKSQEMQKKAEAAPKPRSAPKIDSVTNARTEIPVKQREIKSPPSLPKPIIKSSDPTTGPLVKTVVERTVQQDRLKVTYRNVTINGIEFTYRKDEFSWGGVYFYKNGKNILESTFENETK